MSENPEAKKDIYEQIKDKIYEKTILVTNTSTLILLNLQNTLVEQKNS